MTAGNWWCRSAALYDSPGHIAQSARFFCAYAYGKADRLEAVGYYEYHGIHSYDSDVAVNWWLSSARSSQNVDSWQIDNGLASEADNNRFNTQCYCAVVYIGISDFYTAIAYAPFGDSLVV